MRKGFQLLETRSILDQLELSSIEEKIGMRFPPIFRVFLETFHLPLVSSNDFIAYRPNEEVGFDNLFSSLEQSRSIYLEQPSYKEHYMFPIAHSGIHPGGISVALVGEEAEGVFLENEMHPQRYQKISENIFEFIRGLEEVENGDDPGVYFTSK